MTTKRKPRTPASHINATIVGDPKLSTTVLGGNPLLQLDRTNLPQPSAQGAYVFLFTISPRDQEARSGALGVIKIPGRGQDQLYRFVTSFPENIIMARDCTFTLTEENRLESIRLSGVRAVVDLINPENLGTDLNDQVEASRSMAINRDLSRRGVFYSLRNPPAIADLQAAYARLERFYKDLIERANTIYFSTGESPYQKGNPAPPGELADAVQYFCTDFPWQKKYSSSNPIPYPWKQLKEGK